jgi:hypothetical protein
VIVEGDSRRRRSTTVWSASSPAGWPWLSLRRREVVDVEKGDAEGRFRRPGGLEPVGEEPHEGTVIEESGQGVEAGRLDERRRLPGEPPLGRPEHEEEDDRRHDAGRERDEDDVAAQLGEAGQDRGRVTPDRDDRPDPAVGADRQVLLEDGRRRGGEVGGGRRRGRREDACGVPAAASANRRPGSSPSRPSRRSWRRAAPPEERSSTRTSTVRAGEVAAGWSVARRSAAVGPAVGSRSLRATGGVEERLHRRDPQRPHDVGRAEVRERDQVRARRDPEEVQEDPVDEDEEDGTVGPRSRAGHGR